MIAQRLPVLAHVVAAAMTALLLSALGYWLFVVDRRPPVEILYGEVHPPAVGPNGWIRTIWTLRVTRLCEGTTYREIEDARGVVHVLARGRSPIGDVGAPFTEPRRAIGGWRLMPRGIAAGPATLHVVVRFRCRLWHAWWPIIVALPTLPFEVLDDGSRP